MIIYHVRYWCEDCAAYFKTEQTVLDDTWRDPGCSGHTTRDFCVCSIEEICFHPIHMSDGEYIERTEAGYLNVMRIIWRGSDIVGLPSVFKGMANYPGGEGLGMIRLYDQTNAKTIAELPVTGAAFSIFSDDTLLDVPSGEAVLAIQIRSDGNNAMRFYGSELS